MKPPLFSCLTSRVANNGSLYGRFLFGPLPIDISLTIATVLRRSLLHSQATFTIVSAEIEGAYHEYASLPGIQESVLEILLNLGEIVLTTSQRNYLSPNFRTRIAYSDFYFAFIRVSGPGIVTAKDINWPKGIYCVKPSAYIATLSTNETLTMRLKIACSLNTRGKRNQELLSELETKLKEPSTSVNFFNETNTSLTSHFIRIKKKNLNPKLFGDKITNKTSNTLLAEQTKHQTQKLLTKNLKFLDSYSIRKKKLMLSEPVGLPSLINNSTIFSKNTNHGLKINSYRTIINDYLKSNGLKSKFNITFQVFPLLFNNFIDFSSTKKKSNFSINEDVQVKDYEKLEVDTLKSSNIKKQQNLLSNIERNAENSTLSSKKEEIKKYPLQVKNSSYPVEKVNFLIERDDELAGYRHRIILEVWTNGSISPRQALFESIGSIIKLIYNFREPLRNLS